MKIEIDLSRLQNSDGNYSEADLNVLERATGKHYSEIIKEANEHSQYDFTSEQIGKMSTEEYAKNRDAINKALTEGRIKK